MAGKNYVDPLLSQDSLGYKPHGMINEVVLPSRTVRKNTGKIASYDADNIRLVTSLRGGDSETPVVSMTISQQDAWLIEEHSLKAFSSKLEQEQEDAPFNARRDKSRFVMDLLSIQRELGLQQFMQNTANFTNSLTLAGASQWDAGGDIEADIDTALFTVSDQIGVPVSQLSVLVSDKVQRKIRGSAAIKALVTGNSGLRNTTKATRIDSGEMKDAFECREWIVASGHYNTAEKGQTAVISPIWGNGFWIFNRQVGPEMLTQPFGFTMRRKGGPVVDRWYDNDRKGDWIRGSDEWDQYIVNEKSAFFIKNPFSVALLPQL